MLASSPGPLRPGSLSARILFFLLPLAFRHPASKRFDSLCLVAVISNAVWSLLLDESIKPLPVGWIFYTLDILMFAGMLRSWLTTTFVGVSILLLRGASGEQTHGLQS